MFEINPKAKMQIECESKKAHGRSKRMHFEIEKQNRKRLNEAERRKKPLVSAIHFEHIYFFSV